MENKSEIEVWYDEKYDEWNRLNRHRIEFEITKRYFNQYIPQGKMKILDAGGGPGRYSIYLAKKGHDVTLMDLSQKNVDVALEKAQECGATLTKAVKGNALDLHEFDNDYDVILLMGPLYHLLEKEQRVQAIEQAKEHLKPNGLLVAAFISAYAPIQDYLTFMSEGFESDKEAADLLHYLKDGRNVEDSPEANQGFTTAYFTGIAEAKELMQSCGFTEKVFAGVENIAGCKEEQFLQLSEENQNRWLNIVWELSRDSNVYGTSQHFLYIGNKS